MASLSSFSVVLQECGKKDKTTSMILSSSFGVLQVEKNDNEQLYFSLSF